MCCEFFLNTENAEEGNKEKRRGPLCFSVFPSSAFSVFKKNYYKQCPVFCFANIKIYFKFGSDYLVR